MVIQYCSRFITCSKINRYSNTNHNINNNIILISPVNTLVICVFLKWKRSMGENKTFYCKKEETVLEKWREAPLSTTLYVPLYWFSKVVIKAWIESSACNQVVFLCFTWLIIIIRHVWPCEPSVLMLLHIPAYFVRHDLIGMFRSCIIHELMSIKQACLLKCEHLTILIIDHMENNTDNI